jgi:hypothetical protein
MKLIPHLVALYGILGLADSLQAEKVKWEEIAPTVAVIEKLRTELPTPKPPLRRGQLVSMDGPAIRMPTGSLAFLAHLVQIADALAPVDRKGTLTLLSYLHDRDPHIRFLVSLVLHRYLKSNGLDNDDWDAWSVTQELQLPETLKALDDIVLRISKLDNLDPASEPRNDETHQLQPNDPTPEVPGKGPKGPEENANENPTVIAVDPIWGFQIVRSGNSTRLVDPLDTSPDIPLQDRIELDKFPPRSDLRRTELPLVPTAR